MSKNLNTVTSFVDDGESGTDGVLNEKAGTNNDVQDMRRLGKAQVFKVGRHPIRPLPMRAALTPQKQRNFGFMSIFGFAMILMATWQTLLGYVSLLSI